MPKPKHRKGTPTKKDGKKIPRNIPRQFPIDSNGCELRNYKIVGPKKAVTFTPVQIGNKCKKAGKGNYNWEMFVRASDTRDE
eukprot:CAMPEP_0174269278 /NCGR_PEP_ID=MMETSP0439-20130205/40445_1 /TAXON_ID=0 /ORGANISM="Stereomyxa ramosa, Strain Chinc5" /LENGTH=81 /DNA_ID=CAMNT_0015357963 /DNA_START=1 /DNA_END=243 /DNA_ORIENTATION=+